MKGLVFSDFSESIKDMNSILKNMNYMSEIKVDSPSLHIWADSQFKILRECIEEYEETLDNTHEVGILLTNFGQSILMQVSEVSYRNPVLMVFKGYVNNRESTLIQHINQLNFLLTSIKKSDDKPKNKIGFVVE